MRQRNALAALLGRKPGEVPELASVHGPLPAVEPVVVQGIPAELLLRRPDIRTAAWQVAAQSAQIGVAKADYFPAITLLGSIGWSANSLANSPDTSSLARRSRADLEHVRLRPDSQQRAPAGRPPAADDRTVPGQRAPGCA